LKIMSLLFSLKRDRSFPPRDARAPGGDFPVRFRPRLIQELKQDHQEAREAMHAVLGSCRTHAADDVVLRMQRFGEVFRRSGLLKSVQLYPYLQWALQRDRAATMQLKSLHRSIGHSTMQVDAALSRYLEAPWNRQQRDHYARDVAQAAQVFARMVRQEESAVFPLYLPPGHYRYVESAG
jgi:hypothetical protein